MSSISKLSIRGVRAFSPEADEQCVEFYTPITIITGANGCGKTTVIESLKYAVSGCMPPGCGRGQAFVHDPKSIGQTLVKANVKLRFVNKAGKTMVVVRSMEVTQKKTNMQFKQLDGIIRTMDPETGQRTSLSHKCSDLDKQMVSMLGVQRPILEHVLFCHQEDASWPLSDGAALKKRFDEIFDSSKYTKAIEVFRKTEKDMINRSKDLKVDLSGLQSHKHAAQGFRRELAEVNEQIEELDEQKKKISEAIAQAEENMAKQQAISDQVEDEEERMSRLNSEKERLQLMAAKQRSMLEEDLTHKPITELETMLRDFDDQRSGEIERKNELAAECRELQAKIEKLRQQEMSLTSEMGKHTAAKEAHENRIKERDQKIASMIQTYGIDSLVTQTQGTAFSTSQASVGGTQDTALSTISPAEIEGFKKSLSRKEREMKDDIKNKKEAFQAEEDALQSALTELGGKRKAVENEKAKILAKLSEAQEEHKELSKAVGAGRHSVLRKSDVEDARKLATSHAKKRDDANNDPRRTEIPTEIRQQEEKIDKLKRQIDDDRMTVDALRHSAEAQNTISVLQSQCSKDLECLEEAIREQSYSLQKYNLQSVGQLPGKDGGDDNGDQLVAVVQGLLDAVREKYEIADSEYTRATDTQTKAQQTVSEKTAVLASREQARASLKLKLEAFSETNGCLSKARRVVEDIRQHEGADCSLTADEKAPRGLLKYIDNKLKDLEENAPSTIDPKAAKKLVKRLAKLAKGDEVVTCPCCTRELAAQEAEVFKHTMDDLANARLPELIRVDNATLEEYELQKSNYERWRSVVADNMDDLRDYRRFTEESVELEQEIQRLRDDQERHLSKANDHADKTAELKSEADELRVVMDAAKRLVEDGNRIADRKIEISQKHVDLTASTAIADRDLRTVERQLAERMEEKDLLTNKINRLNREMTALNNTITQLSNQASRLDQVARDKEARFAAEEKATVRKAELCQLLEQYSKEDKKLSDELIPLKQKLKTKEKEKERLRSVFSQEEDAARVSLDQFMIDKNNFLDLTMQIDQYAGSDKSQGVDIAESQLSDLRERVKKTKKVLSEKRPELEKLTNAANDQERHKKQLKLNIECLEAERKIESIDDEIKGIQAAVSKIEGYSTYQQLYNAAKAVKEKKTEEQARAGGRRTELWQQMTALKRKLKTPEYKDIDERCRVASIKFETTKIAADDLKKYYTALDKALLQFHQAKIKEINKIIRELWLMTYKGEDITNIELRSGQEAGSKASKSYNYRVVMTKGGNATLDMRGRCSAGQRVLASIVIRFALAETFGVDCGCLALDEPTVNLDYRNKRGLAIALAQIVASRASQRNFQLVLITHDEEFVSLMKTELSSQTGFSMPESFFRVRREQAADGKYYSKIDKIDWDELA